VTESSKAPGRANLERVAALAGVSRSTVSRVVNGWASVDPELRARVERSIAELGYVPNQAARTLVTQRTDTVALVVSEPDERIFGDPFFGGIVRGVSQGLIDAGLQMVLLMAQSQRDLDRIEKSLRAAPPDGVLLISEHAGYDPLPAAMIQAGVPLIIGGRPLQPGLAIGYVDNDNVAGALLAVEHLLARGCAVIGTITGPQDMSAGVDRLAGFAAGLGRAFRADRVEGGDFTQLSGEIAVGRLLGRAPDLDGLFVASDLMALGAMSALRRAGRRVPEDVAVVGFDDIALAALADPPLTTIRQQPILQGRAMVHLLLATARPDLAAPRADDLPDPQGSDHLVLPVHLVVRESS
jgi:DNA-binding LacI/PurR family transcriptional regulator